MLSIHRVSLHFIEDEKGQDRDLTRDQELTRDQDQDSNCLEETTEIIEEKETTEIVNFRIKDNVF